jgi:hypothetical protein
MGETVSLDYSSLFGGSTPSTAPGRTATVKPTSNAQEAKPERSTGADLATESAIFNQAWQLLKQYRHLKRHGSAIEWEQVTAKANQIYSIGAGTVAEDLSKEMSFMILRYLDRISAENEAGDA